jgi:putative flippase GtrA
MKLEKDLFLLLIKKKVLMNRILALFNKYEQFLKFSIVGVVNTAISLVVYGILIRLGFWYMLSSVIGYLVGLLNGYIANSIWVFNKKLQTKTSAKFIGVYLSALLFNLIILYLLVDVMTVNSMLAQVMVVGFNLIYNYTLNKLWTFRHE